MAIYAVGDLQGCLDPLKGMLDEAGFDPARDRLWLVGDLVNRGPQSLETLRFVKGLGEAALTVLGNHDLHLLAVYHGVHEVRRKDTIAPLLAAPDCKELMEWLAGRPLIHHDPALGFTLVHAGLPPQWTIADAITYSREIEDLLMSADRVRLLRRMYGDEPSLWDDGLTGWDRARYITNAFTRMRFVTAGGRLEFKHKCAPGAQPSWLMPWYEVPGRRSRDQRIVFGHWSTVGLVETGHNAWALDGGCVWGGSLTLMRLDGEAPIVTQRRCPQAMAPR